MIIAKKEETKLKISNKLNESQNKLIEDEIQNKINENDQVKRDKRNNKGKKFI
jgi:hypothetical protein